MTLLHMNGFEGATKTGSALRNLTSTFVAGRTGLALRCDASGEGAVVTIPGGKTEIVCGVAVRQTGLSTASFNFIQFSNFIGGNEISITRGSNGATVEVRVNNSIVATAGPPSWDIWNYFEVKIRHADAGGTIQVKLNGALIIDWTGDNKTQTTAGLWSVLLLGDNNWPTEYDDFYLLDNVDATATQGRPFNDFLGPIRVEPLLPNGAGASAQWVGSDGNSIDNHLLVDEPSPANTTDWVETSTVGQRDLYEFANPTTLTGQVLAVEVVSHSVAPDGGSPKIKSVVRSNGGTVATGPGTVPNVVWSTISDGPMAKDPDGNPWTLATLAAAQFGVELG